MLLLPTGAVPAKRRHQLRLTWQGDNDAMGCKVGIFCMNFCINSWGSMDSIINKYLKMHQF
jgi:hypothetical protein